MIASVDEFRAKASRDETARGTNYASYLDLFFPLSDKPVRSRT